MAMADPDTNNPILPDLQPSVYVFGVLNGGNESELMFNFLKERMKHLESEMKDQFWNPPLKRMKEAFKKIKDAKYGKENPTALSIQHQNDKIVEYLDHKLMDIFVEEADISEMEGYEGDPTMDFIIKHWDSVVLSIKGNRQGISEFLYEIFGDILTKESIERMEYFKENNKELKKNTLAALNVLIQTTRENYEKSQSTFSANRKMFVLENDLTVKR